MRWLHPKNAPLLLVVAAVSAGCRSEAPVHVERPVDRILVVSLPGLTWEAARPADLPALDGFVREAAVGDVSTRIGRHAASTTEAYLTIGAGTRAVAPLVDVAVALDPDELYGGVASRDILDRRLGEVPAGVAYLAAGAAIDANERSAFGADVGLLGDRLEDAGIGRAVIANADAAEGFVSNEPPPDGAYARSAATALMGRDGQVPAGTVGRGLLATDPDAPFGRRLDTGAVLAAFDQVWTEAPTVVLVEASDLSRASAYRPRATSAQSQVLTEEALKAADHMLDQLLERVEADHDAVLVISPVSGPGAADLAMVALRAPGVEPGVLRSASTGRDGYVHLADVAPTILTLLGEPVPGGIEGAPFGVRSRAGEDRVEGLMEAADAAAFRDAVLPAVVAAVILVLAALCLAAWQRRRLPARIRLLLRPAAFAALGLVPATFLVGRLQATVSAPVLYAAVVVVIAAAIGLVSVAFDHRWPGLGAVVALAAIVGMFLVDVSLGAPLQLNTVFGYSLSVAGRFAGVGNLAFALLGAASILLAVLVADRYGRRGVTLAVALLALVVLVEGLPMLGADVGGVLSMIPAFGVTALVLAGRRVRAAHIALLVAVGVAAVAAFAAIDLARPAEFRTHLGRITADVLDGRWSLLGDSLTRRWQASFGNAEVAGWLVVFGLLTVAVAYAALVRSGWSGPSAPRRRPDRPARAAMAGLAVLAGIGLVANDSSIAVPATMLIVIAPVAVLQALAGRPPLGAGRRPATAP